MYLLPILSELSWDIISCCQSSLIIGGQVLEDFSSTLEQKPAMVGSPDRVMLKCGFDRPRHAFSAVEWSRGEPAQLLYHQTQTASQVLGAHDDIIGQDDGQLQFSENMSVVWSEATLTMQVDRCLADTYLCTITDTNSHQSESQITLKFEGKWFIIIHTILDKERIYISLCEIFLSVVFQFRVSCL